MNRNREDLTYRGQERGVSLFCLLFFCVCVLGKVSTLSAVVGKEDLSSCVSARTQTVLDSLSSCWHSGTANCVHQPLSFFLSLPQVFLLFCPPTFPLFPCIHKLLPAPETLFSLPSLSTRHIVDIPCQRQQHSFTPVITLQIRYWLEIWITAN